METSLEHANYGTDRRFIQKVWQSRLLRCVRSIRSHPRFDIVQINDSTLLLFFNIRWLRNDCRFEWTCLDRVCTNCNSYNHHVCSCSHRWTRLHNKCIRKFKYFDAILRCWDWNSIFFVGQFCMYYINVVIKEKLSLWMFSVHIIDMFIIMAVFKYFNFIFFIWKSSIIYVGKIIH